MDASNDTLTRRVKQVFSFRRRLLSSHAPPQRTRTIFLHRDSRLLPFPSRLESYCQTPCRLSHTFLRYRPFRLSTLDPRLPQEGGELQVRLARTHPFQLTRGSLTEFGGPRSLPCPRDRGLPLPRPPAPRRTPSAERSYHYNIPAKARKSQFNESTGFRTQDSEEQDSGFRIQDSPLVVFP